MKQIPKFLLAVIFLMTMTLSPFFQCKAMEGPDTVELDALAQLYEPVNFDHVMHVDVAEADCATCHHHTTGTPVKDKNCAKCHANSGATDEVACRECHPAKRFEAEYLKKMAEDNTLFHVGKVGLKAAYHLRCMGCHQEMGAPNGCQDCHTRNDAGDKFFHSGKYAPPEGKEPVGGHHE